jgi:hypothetical protein
MINNNDIIENLRKTADRIENGELIVMEINETQQMRSKQIFPPKNYEEAGPYTMYIRLVDAREQ